MAKTLYVVSHTHWDREWYLTFQQFRMRLVDLLDNLFRILEKGEGFQYFSLDAQTIVLEDYLAIKPQKRATLEKYIREGRITVGPWYQLNDEFLTSGEATVRSLLVGSRIAQSFGACQKLGYLPDQFGNISQMPQIFRGFGIDNAIVGRGYQLVGDRKMEFFWQSPDGSQVLTSLMAHWYNNAQHLPADPVQAKAYVLGIRDRMSPLSATSALLLMNGVDHLEAQEDLGSILTALQESLPSDTAITHATLPHYIDAIREEIAQKSIPLETHVGELREDRGGSCLAGTLSTRMHLKQANSHAQTLLERHAEPFAAFALQTGTPYPYEFLHYAWKLLMNNHPHDSICGCSLDQVHREMEPRFEQVEQIGEEVVKRSLQAVADRIQTSEEGTHIAVFNSLAWERTDPVTTTLVFPLGVPTRGNPPRDDSKQVHGFRIFDSEGQEIPFVVERVEVKMQTVLSPVELPLDQWVQEYQVTLVASKVPAGGYKTYRVTPTASMPQYAPPEERTRAYPQNKLYSVGEVGDEYLYKPPLNDVAFRSGTAWGRKNSHHLDCLKSVEITKEAWALPKSATPDTQGRSSEEVECHLEIRKTLWHHTEGSEVQIRFDNRAKDHLLTYGIGFNPKKAVLVTEGQYDAIERPITPHLAEEGASPFYPQQYWSAVTQRWGGRTSGDEKSEGLHTLTVANRGLPCIEMATSHQEIRQLRVVLLRCVEYLSRRGDGPQFLTPEAQCQGEHTFDLFLKHTEGDWKEGKVWKTGHEFNVGLKAIQTEIKAGDNRTLPTNHSFLSISSESLIVTAFKRAEDDPNTLILRFFNTVDEPVEQATIRLAGAREAARVNLNEEPLQPLVIQEGAILLQNIRPKEIVTLAFRL